MAARFVDFHCHLDLYKDFAAEVMRCEEEEVFTLAVTTTPKAWTRNQELASRTRHVRAALGLHPQLVQDRAAEIGLWEELLPRTRYVGEVGLDAGPRFYASFEKQKAVFERILTACASAGDKILSVHSVRSVKTVLDMIEQLLPPSRGKVVLHWFTGSASEARRALELGCYFSINAQMLIKPESRGTVAQLARNRILTETDGPFTQVSGSPSRPFDVGKTISTLAPLLSLDADDAANLVLENLKSLLAETR